MDVREHAAAAIVTPPRNLELLVVADREDEVARRPRFFLLSRHALPASSRTSAAMYSRTAVRYTGAPAP